MDNSVMLIKVGDYTCSVDGGFVILEATPLGRKEMLQQGVKIIIIQYH